MSEKRWIIPPERTRYLAEIVETCEGYDAFVRAQAAIARRMYQLHGTHRGAPRERREEATRDRRADGPRRRRPRHRARRGGARVPRRAGRALPRSRGAPRARVQEAPRRVAGDQAALRGREVPVPGARQGHRARSRLRVALAPAHPEGRRCPSTRTGATSSRGSCARAPPGPVPVHRRRLPAQARERRSGAHVRRRGRARAHEQALPLRLARAPGEAPLDGVRLGHALRRGPRSPAGHLRQGRQLGRLDRQRRRREEALLRLRSRRSGDVGLDDDQRPGADAARLLPERRHRSELREVDHEPRARSPRSSGRSTRSSRGAASRGRPTRARSPRGTTASA